MDTITKIREKAKSAKKKIVLPEYNDKRVSEAARIIEGESIAQILLLTPERMERDAKKRYIEEYCQLSKGNNPDIDSIRKLFEDPLYYAAMMVREGAVDGFVAGASHTTADVARAAIHCVGVDKRFNLLSSCFIMILDNSLYGENGTFVYADCGIIPEPNSRQLSCICVTAAELAERVLDIKPRIAFLSYSTKGSAKGRAIDKVTEAIRMAKAVQDDLLIDGEMQVDAAIVPEVARIKYPDSPVAGKANVLIFPDLNAGNISYKLTERLAGARALGPLLLGLNKPCSDLSRGCSAQDVVDCVAVTAIRAQ